MEPESGERWRLKGGLYEREFDAAREIEAKAQRAAREYGKPDAGAAEYFAQRVERHISSRAQYNQNRYAPAIERPGIGNRTNEEPNPLENHKRPSAVPSPERADSLADYLSSRLGVLHWQISQLTDNQQQIAMQQQTLQNMEKRTFGINLQEDQNGKFVVLSPGISLQSGWTAGKNQAYRITR